MPSLRCLLLGHYYRYEHFEAIPPGYMHSLRCTCGHETLVEMITDDETVTAMRSVNAGSFTIDLEDSGAQLPAL